MFSQVNIIKSNKRTSLTNETLDDLVMVSTMNIPLPEFNPDKAIDLWWREKTRRPNQSERSHTRGRVEQIQIHQVMVPLIVMPSLLDDWDHWVDIA